MGLQFAFDCPRTLNRLQSGPLAEVLDGFCRSLCEAGFGRHCIREHLSNVSHLNEYLAEQGVSSINSLTSESVDSFFDAYSSRCRNRGPLDNHLRRVKSSVNRFTAYLQEAEFVDWTSEFKVHQPLLDGYLQWMREFQGAASGTLGIREGSLTQFLESLGPKATPEGLSSLSVEEVERFFLRYGEKKGRAARRSMQSALRTFLRFSLYRGYIRQPLDGAVPTLRTYKRASVPRGLTDKQAQKVIENPNRNTPAGRRDYAILQLLYTYGVRGGHVRALRLEHIGWEEDQIIFPALKQGKDCLLPLTQPVGEALLDYLRHSRPPCGYSEVFLTCRAPYRPLAHSNALSAIVERHISAAGIDAKSNGAHAFRHSFATRMLKEGHSLKEIADVLGHRHIETTFLYTKGDLEPLKQVPLDWPGEVKP